MSFVVCACESSGNATFCSNFQTIVRCWRNAWNKDGDRTEVILIGFIGEYLEQCIVRLMLSTRELKEGDQDVRRTIRFVRRTSLMFGASSSSAKKYTPWADVASWISFAAAAPLADLDMSTNGSNFAAR